MARPLTTSWSEEAKAQVIEHVVSQIASGRALSRVLREDDGMPSSPTFYGWLFNNEELSSKVERAREFGAAALIDEIVDIADDSSSDVYVAYEGKGEDRTPIAKVDGDVIQRAKLRVYAREKQAAMIAPRRYGAKLDLTSGGEKLPANQVTQTKVDALIAVGVDKALKQRQLQLPPPEEKNDDQG